MAKQKEKKQTPVSRLMEYAGSFQYLAVASWVLAAVSAFVALVPFYFIWRLIKEVLRVAPDYGAAQNLSTYGWSAVGFAILSMLIYIGALICSHLAAFRVQANMRSRLMRHILSLPIGFMDDEGSGKIRKIVNESSAATETYLAHQLPDKYVATATPVGLAALLLVFDWKLGLLCLIPVVVAFLVMGAMMGENMKKKMEEYQNALEEMSGEAVEYVRGIPVVKTFGQSVFSFKRFRDSIKKYEKWTISYTKDLRLPMMGYTVAINSVFAILIAAVYLLGGVKSGTADSPHTPVLRLRNHPACFPPDQLHVQRDCRCYSTGREPCRDRQKVPAGFCICHPENPRPGMSPAHCPESADPARCHFHLLRLQNTSSPGCCVPCS